MDTSDTLKTQVKQLLVENLMLPTGIDDISDSAPLFGPGGLGLDSVDALQLVVALDKHHGLKIPNPDVARQVLQSVDSITAALREHLALMPASPTPPKPAVN